MTIPFTPGELSGPQARALNELARVAEQFSRLTVAAPLSLTRPAGIPAIRIDDIGGMDIFLVEITGNSGTPPVHTGKRKTRDTSNNVIDLSPEVDYTQILNPLETVWPDGTLVAIFPIPEYDNWWWGIPIESNSTPLPAGVLCEPHGWLADRQAIIDMASATPKRVLTYEVLAGATGGRCDCIVEQGRDSTQIPYPYTAFWNAGTGTWVGSVFIKTCCGCARIEFDIIEENNDTIDDQPPIKATLYLIGTICDESGRTSYPMKYQCSGRDYAEFAGAGTALCSGVSPFPCDNSFLVTVKCADCTLAEGPDCQYCKEICGPPIFTVTVSGMTGGYTAYNGTWYLIPDGDCTWRATCGSLIVTLTITVVSGTTYVTVTFAGASGGGLTYKDIGTSNSNILCASDRTLNTVSPPNPALGVPSTIAVSTVTCTSCPDFCTWLVANHPTLHVTFGSDGTGSVACINGTSWTLTWDAVNSWWTTGIVFPPGGCSPNTQGDFKITCANGRLTLISEFTGPPTPFSLTNQVSRTVSPLVVVLNGAITATITG